MVLAAKFKERFMKLIGRRGFTRIFGALPFFGTTSAVALAKDTPAVPAPQRIDSRSFQPTLDGGQVLDLPIGSFDLPQEGLILRPGSVIRGQGYNTSLRYGGTGRAIGFDRTQSGTPYANVKLLNFRLQAASSAPQVGVEIVNGYQVTLDGLYIDGGQNVGGFKTAGIHINGSTNETNSAIIRIINGEMWFCGGAGVLIDGPGSAAGVWIERSHISGNQYGVRQSLPPNPKLFPAANLQIHNNVLEGNVNGSILLDTAIATGIVGNYFENSDGSGAIHIEVKIFAQGFDVQRNLFGAKAAPYAIVSSYLRGGTIQDNTFAGSIKAVLDGSSALSTMHLLDFAQHRQSLSPETGTLTAIKIGTGINCRIAGNVPEPETVRALYEIMDARSVKIQTDDD